MGSEAIPNTGNGKEQVPLYLKHGEPGKRGRCQGLFGALLVVLSHEQEGMQQAWNFLLLMNVLAEMHYFMQVTGMSFTSSEAQVDLFSEEPGSTLLRLEGRM